MDLAELIKTEGITFYSGKTKLDTDIGYFDKNDQNIVDKLAAQASQVKRKLTDEIILIKGEYLQEYLSEPDNLFRFTDFLVQLITKTPLDNFLKVETDIASLRDKYETLEDPESIIPLYYTKRLKEWAPRLTTFQRCWYLSLDFHMGSYIGHPSYEHPLNTTEFWQRKHSLDQIFRLRQEKQQ